MQKFGNNYQRRTIRYSRQFFGSAKYWPNGVTCPRCGSDSVAFLEKYNRWQCNSRSHKDRQFTSKTGTIFEDSPLGIDKWLTAMWLLVNCKKEIGSYEVSGDLGISQKSAWHLLHRIRLAAQDGLTGGMLSGEVEVDETFIGSKARNMHKERRVRKVKRGGDYGKAIVLGMLERKGRVVASVVPDRTKAVMQEHVRGNVEQRPEHHSDDAASQWRMDDEYVHKIVNHAETYVNGNIRTNGLENFWSLLQRGLGGTYISVQPFHLFRYIDEQAFRYNNRKGMTDSARFVLAVRQIVGKRLTWAQVTGNAGQPTPA